MDILKSRLSQFKSFTLDQKLHSSAKDFAVELTWSCFNTTTLLLFTPWRELQNGSRSQTGVHHSYFINTSFISWLTLTANTWVLFNSERHLNNKQGKPHDNHPKFVIDRSDTNHYHRYPASTFVCVQIICAWFILKFISRRSKATKRQPWTLIPI